MNEMTERVARAVMGDLLDRRGIRQAFDEIDDGLKAEIRATIGRLAIEAMREPSAAMRTAGGDVHPGNDYLGPDEIEPSAVEIYQAMIDAALKE